MEKITETKRNNEMLFVKIILGFAYLFTCSILLYQVSPALNSLYGSLIGVAKTSFQTFEFVSILMGIGSVLLNMLVTISRPLALVLFSFFIALSGISISKESNQE